VALLSLDPPIGEILVVNAGSTSLKLSIVDAVERSRPLAGLAEASGVGVVGHRIVHGGPLFVDPVVIDDGVVASLESLVELAPLHNAPAVDAIHAVQARLPGAVQVAVFDTAFHRTLPERAATYPLPARFRERGVRRYGFHGLSLEWAVTQVAASRLVVCHLGGGSSVTAVLDGRSVDTSMGLTPLEGVPMTTRAGSIDPGALLYLLRNGVSVDELEYAMVHESGLTGLAGTGDVAELERGPSPAAVLALDIFAYRVAQAIAAMAVALGGLDALVFTGGIGEHAAGVRAAVCARLGWLGVVVDQEANAGLAGDGRIDARSAAVRVHVVRSHEDVVVARHVRAVLGSSL